MNLAVFSSKRCWLDEESRPVTVGGFPKQMRALSEIFDATTIWLPLETNRAPDGAQPIEGGNLAVQLLPPISGEGLRRKLALIRWLARSLSHLVKAIRDADCVHTPVPGDIGAVAMLMAWLLRRRLIVRYCGTWGDTSTLANRFLSWVLPRIASSRTLVLATGGGSKPPAANKHIHWIFSTALSRDDLERSPVARPWSPGEDLRLISVGRLTRGKNHHSIIEAMPKILACCPRAHLEILGDGPSRKELEQLVNALSLADRVRIVGHVAHRSVSRRLSKSHLFLFPTRVAEGFPKAVLEAMASGLPILASPVSVLPHLLAFDVSDQACGIPLSPPEPDRIAEAVAEAIQVPGQLAEMGSRARAESARYSLENWRDSIRMLVQESWGAL